MIAADLGSALWHDLECGSYRADLSLWRDLAVEAGGPVLDIGCGTGRVALDLAAQGHTVTALDSDPELIAALAKRARDDGLELRTAVADARSFDLARHFALAIAPMQVVQLLGGAPGRIALLECVLRHLEPGGRFAAALADPFEGVELNTALPPLPDVREQDEWVLSSTPVELRQVEGAIEIDHHRQAVSPAGELSEALVTVRLDSVAPATLVSEGEAAGLIPAGTRRVPETHEFVGSTVVLLEAPG